MSDVPDRLVPDAADGPSGSTPPGATPAGPTPPARVRVTAPRTGAVAASARARGPVGASPGSEPESVYVRSLIRSQLRLGVTYAAGFAAATALFVLAIVLTPVFDDTFVWGVPLSWLLLAVGVYPLAITVGVLYARAAARNEARYRALTEAG
ncbi:heavy metal transporter [Agromyces sp. NPDC058110]|uniref:heavy metal transporter n=1 Tax=Agromyces sp. NPDC058110 TaxID=3346345 RepID=UPI0036DDFD37